MTPKFFNIWPARRRSGAESSRFWMFGCWDCWGRRDLAALCVKFDWHWSLDLVQRVWAPARCTSTVHQHGAPDMTARVQGFFALTDDGLFFQQLISSWERFLLLRLHNATIRVVCQKLQGCPNHQPVSLPERTVLVDCLLGMTAMFKYCGSCLQPAPRTYTVTLHPSDYVQHPGEWRGR